MLVYDRIQANTTNDQKTGQRIEQRVFKSTGCA